MIVQESDLLLAALDRRLQVDRALPIGSLTALGEEATTPGLRTLPDAPASAASVASAATPSSASFARGIPAADQTSLASRLPLGRVVDARVLSLNDDGQVTADIDRWRVALAWPSGGGPLPRVGDDVRLRVLAHQPMLLFQNVPEAPRDVDDPFVHWSRDARELARSTSPTRAEAGVRRFTAPILDVEAPGATAGDDVIGIDDVVVGHSVFDSGNLQRNPAAGPGADTTLPVVLQGPAWIGQPLELVVRRERADEELDNPALDQWCGDIGIDLPRLGRVAGHLSLSMQGLKLRLEGEDAVAVATMTAASPGLAAALGGCSLRVQALSIGCLHPPVAGPDER